jgi:hypothetical protein
VSGQKWTAGTPAIHPASLAFFRNLSRPPSPALAKKTPHLSHLIPPWAIMVPSCFSAPEYINFSHFLCSGNQTVRRAAPVNSESGNIDIFGLGWNRKNLINVNRENAGDRQISGPET